MNYTKINAATIDSWVDKGGNGVSSFHMRNILKPQMETLKLSLHQQKTFPKNGWEI